MIPNPRWGPVIENDKDLNDIIVKLQQIHDSENEDLSSYSYEFERLEECYESGDHLLSVDDDGYCNRCGFQEISDSE